MKRIIFKKIPLILVILLIYISCDPVDHKLKIVNNSTLTIYFSDSFSYPDTSITELNPFKSPEVYRIRPGATDSDPIRGSWEAVFETLDTLMIFIFDERTLNKVPWDTVRKNYMILKRYDLSLEDLVRLDWRVTYP